MPMHSTLSFVWYQHDHLRHRKSCCSHRHLQAHAKSEIYSQTVDRSGHKWPVVADISAGAAGVHCKGAHNVCSWKMHEHLKWEMHKPCAPPEAACSGLQRRCILKLCMQVNVKQQRLTSVQSALH